MKSGHLIYGRADFEAPMPPIAYPGKWVSRLEYRKTVTRYQSYGTVLHQRR